MATGEQITSEVKVDGMEMKLVWLQVLISLQMRSDEKVGALNSNWPSVQKVRKKHKLNQVRR